MANYRHQNQFGDIGDKLKRLWNSIVHNREFNRGAAWGAMILGALLAFEIFNFSTTQFALEDMLGDLSFGGFKWATVLAVAFCGIDFAGIARIFTPEQGRDEPAEVYYLFGAWILAAGFNAMLTWWGVSVAIANNGGVQSAGSISSQTLNQAVPILVAGMVWLVRLLIIGTFSLAGDRLFTTAQVHSTQTQYSRPAPAYNNPQPRPQPQPQSRPVYQSQSYQRPVNQPSNQPVLRPASQINRPVNSNNFRPAPKPVSSQQSSFIPPEPTYHPVYEARSSDNSDRKYDA